MLLKSCAHNIETHYKDITSHFQKADNNLHQSTRIYTNLHEYARKSTPIYTIRMIMNKSA